MLNGHCAHEQAGSLEWKLEVEGEDDALVELR